jgi:cytochrome b561
MPANSLLHQASAREVDLAPSCHSASTHAALIDARPPSFDGLTIGLHWATVLLVLALFASAWLRAIAGHESDFAPALLQFHRSFGVTLWVVTAFRLAWRLTNASMPPFPPQMTGLHRLAVKFSEYGLYALLLGQPATGLLTTLAGGRPFALFLWPFPPLMAGYEVLRAVFHLSHEVGAWALAALAVSHAGAALFHHFVLRDDVLQRMAPGIQRRVPSRSAQTATSFRSETHAGNKSDPLRV